MAIVNYTITENTFFISYLDGEKTIYRFSSFPSGTTERPCTLSIDNGLQNTYSTLELYNTEMILLGQPPLAVDPFGPVQI
jgi:hypothetical protein